MTKGSESEKEILKALEFMNLPTDQKIKLADIGCGSGVKLMSLTENHIGQITIIDFFMSFKGT